MNFRNAFYLWAGVPLLLGAGLLPSLVISLVDKDGLAAVYAEIALALLCLALVARYLGRAPHRLEPALSNLVVVLAWLGAGFLGALPYYFGGVLPSLTASVFESVSGFTATGSTVLTAIEATPHSLLFWRSLTHWIGGIGIILMVLAVLPRTVGSRMLYGAEAPLSLDAQPHPRLSAIIRSYLAIYTGLTVVQILLLVLGPMNLFEAICHSFASIAGGGFSTRALSVGAFHDLYTEIVLMIFMMAGATSFYAHFRALIERKPRAYLQNAEVRLFVAITVLASLLCAGSLVIRQGLSVGNALRDSTFQVVSIITTTGFATRDFELWPVMPRVLLIVLMFVGGCSASTSGSIKVVRYQVTAKSLLLQLRRILHPNLVQTLRLGKRVLRSEQVEAVQLYFLAYLGLATVAVLGLSILGVDGTSAITGVAATLGNVGPGLGHLGPYDDFAHLPQLGSWILVFCMLAGRLEILGLAALFLPELWRYGRRGVSRRPKGKSFMANVTKSIWVLALLLLLGSLAACGRKTEVYPQAHPIVEQTDLTPLHEAIERARSDIASAKALASSQKDDVKAQKLLDDAIAHLDDLRYYYVPLTAARESALNALRESWGNRPAQRDTFLSRTRGQLLSVLARSGPQVEKMVEVQLEILSDAEAEARAGQDVRPRIEALASEIQHALTVAPLVLDENKYHNPAGE
jgi:trk system potassium uptake protein TrkH